MGPVELAGLERRRRYDAEREAARISRADDEVLPEAEEAQPVPSDSELVSRMLRNPTIVDLGKNFLELNLTV